MVSAIGLAVDGCMVAIALAALTIRHGSCFALPGGLFQHLLQAILLVLCPENASVDAEIEVLRS
jgi:hypothetical protein